MIDETNLTRKYDHFSHVSFPDYFLQLLELQAIDWLRLPLFQGLATSTVVGSEGLIRSSRLALVQCINSRDATEQHQFMLMIIRDLSAILGENLQDDRYAIPTMELLAFLIDGYISSIPEGSEPMYDSSYFPWQRITGLSNLSIPDSGNSSSSSKKRTSSHRTFSVLKPQSGPTDHCQDSWCYGLRCSRR